MNLNDLYLVCVLTSFFTVFWFHSSIYHIYCLGKSRSKIKKELHNISFISKVSLKGYVKNSSYHLSTAKKLCIVYWVYCVVFILCSVSYIGNKLFVNCSFLFKFFSYTKLLCDFIFSIYFLIMTRHDKSHGGVTFVWTKGSKKLR